MFFPLTFIHILAIFSNNVFFYLLLSQKRQAIILNNVKLEIDTKCNRFVGPHSKKVIFFSRTKNVHIYKDRNKKMWFN